MITRVEGVVISEVSYRETSKIINVITKEYGKIGMIAKGAKRINSKLRTGTMTYMHGVFHIYYKEDKLSTLTEVDIINDFSKARSDLLKLSYITFITEVFNQVIRNDYNSAWYDDYIAALTKIEEGYDASIITNIYELKILKILGIMPELNSCIICGNKNNIKTFSIIKGGFVCTKHADNDPIYDEKTIKLLRMLSYVDLAKISKLDIKDEITSELDLIINQYFEEYSGLYLNSKQMLNKLKETV